MYRFFDWSRAENIQRRDRSGRIEPHIGSIAAALENLLAQPARDALRDGMDHVTVDLLGDFAGKMRGPVGHSLTWKCNRIWDAEECRHSGKRENY